MLAQNDPQGAVHSWSGPEVRACAQPALRGPSILGGWHAEAPPRAHAAGIFTVEEGEVAQY